MLFVCLGWVDSRFFFKVMGVMGVFQGSFVDS